MAMPQCGTFILERLQRASEEFEVKDARKRTAFGGGPTGPVLEFKFL
jgi:hypothetical protein